MAAGFLSSSEFLLFVSELKSKVDILSFAFCEYSSDDRTWANGDVMHILDFGVIKVGGIKMLSGEFHIYLEFGHSGVTF